MDPGVREALEVDEEELEGLVVVRVWSVGAVKMLDGGGLLDTISVAC